MPQIVSKSRLSTIAAAAFMIAASVWLRAQFGDNRPVAELMPSGALLYLEAKDFHGMLTDWNGSNVKSRWLASANFSVLSESRLIQRLAQAQEEFAAVVGVPIGMSFLDQTAGGRSGFAFYNFSTVKFVYLTQLPQNRLDSTALWRDRDKYTRREVSGIAFYLKSDQNTARTVAFAGYKDWFLVAADENLAAETLILLSGGNNPSIATEPWFREASKQAATNGDLRLVYNMTALIATPQFRTYWLHRNASELKPFSTGISDLFRQTDSFEEQRTLLRKTEASLAADQASLRDALTFVPSSDSLYRAWSMPDRDNLSESLQQVISGERTQVALFNPPAPEVSAEAGSVGSESDLEIRIDEPPFERASQLSIAPLVDAIVAMQPAALLHVQTTRLLRDNVFLMPASGVVIICKQPDRAALDKALTQVTGPLGPEIIDPLRVSIDGNAVVLSRLNLSRANNSGAQLESGVNYVAVYNHAAEWPGYKKLFAILDRTPSGPEGPISPNTPPFFSANLESIGDSLARLQKASIFSADTGAAVHETVRYELARQ